MIEKDIQDMKMRIFWEVCVGEISGRKCIAAICYIGLGKTKEKLCGLSKMGDNSWIVDFGLMFFKMGELKFPAELSLAEAQSRVLDFVKFDLKKTESMLGQVLESIEKMENKK